MTITRQVTVWCDVCALWVMVDGHNIKAARAAARASGWRHTNDQDVCPGCVNSDA